MLEQLQEDVHLLLHQLQQESTRTPSRLIRCVDFVGVTSSLTAFAEADGRGNLAMRGVAHLAKVGVDSAGNQRVDPSPSFG
jgi:hypothetical protein